MNRSILVTSFEPFLLPFFACFTGPTAQTFTTLVAAWILAVGPRTVTNLVRTLGPNAPKSHDAYQYFFSKAAWSPEIVWMKLFHLIVSLDLIPTDAVIEVSGDDTLLHHSGRKIFGVGIFRDAVRSSKKHVAYASGHNWVILCWILPVPFAPGVHLAVPIHARLRPKQLPSKGARTKHPKLSPTVVQLLGEMLREVTSWAPQRQFRLLADGAYACLAGQMPAQATLISRLRKDAALYGPPPARRPGQRGRPRKMGERLPTPARRAKAPRLSWTSVRITLYGETRDLRLHSYQAYWYEVCPDHPISIVIVRDPTGEHDDEFFFTTDLTLGAELMVTAYSRRWSQEVIHREAKNEMGIEDPQARVEHAVQRQAPFCLVILSLVKLWYLIVGYQEDSLIVQRDAWYKHKDGISFRDMLGALRYGNWRRTILGMSGLTRTHRKNLVPLLRVLALAS